MRNLDSIIIHCSDSPFGDALTIDQWHRKRGFDCIGYHFVILNGFPKNLQTSRIPFLDGSIESGRDINLPGAHVRGHNETSIGVCLIGQNGDFTSSQMAALKKILWCLKTNYSIPVSRILGHYELDSNKTCPDLDMNIIRNNFMENRK